MNNSPLAKLAAFIGSFFALFIGRIAWTSPPWIIGLRRKIAARPGVSIAIALIIVASMWVIDWYIHRPQPVRITATITAPQITQASKDALPDVVTLDFTKPVAPLKMIGKDATTGYTFTPALTGKWVWQTDSRLIFIPNNDWLAGQTYNVHFEKSFFANEANLASLTYSFATIPFNASIAEYKFYQDPTDPKIREAVATIHFNYPVDTNSFEKNTELTFQDNNATVKFTVTYDEFKRVAYLRSEPLPLPSEPRFLQLILGKNIKPVAGNATDTLVTQKLTIPDAGSFFKVSNVTAAIVRNEQDKPGQVLTLETTLGVTEAELNKSLHVYVLPRDYPATSVEAAKSNYPWQNPGEVTADILKLATPVSLQSIPADRDYATLHSYKFNAPAPRYLYIKLDKGIHGFGDYALTNDYVAIVKVPEYPKEISFLHKGALLALSGEKKLSVLVRGVPAVKFEIARVLPDDVNQLITQTSGNFNDPRFINRSFTQQNISELFSTIQSFDTTDAGKEQYTALDLGKYLSTKANVGGPKGLFLLEARGWDVEKKTPLNIKARRLILITDLGLIVKDNIDGTHDVFVQSITQENPVEKATVTILGKNGLPLLSRVTDNQGRVTFPVLTDFTDEREPTVYLASLGNDVAFIPYNNSDRQLNFSRFDIGGIVSNQEQQSLSAYLFTDRGIYRPGDTAHVGIIVKQAYAEPQPAGLPLEAIVTDPRGNTVKDQKFTLNAEGYLTFDIGTQPTSPTGQYTVNVYIVKDSRPNNLLGGTTIRVNEFQPDRMRITTSLSVPITKGWISPEKLHGEVDLWNLYGAAATDRKISAKILLAPQSVKFTEYPNYTFVDPLFDPKKPPKVFSDTLTETQTDSKGHAEFDLNLQRFEKATYELTFFAEGFEAGGGRSVTSQVTALVSPLAYFVGYKADGDLTYIKQSSQRSVNFIAVNPALKQQALDHLKIQLVELRPVTTLVKKPSGLYQYESVMQTTVLSTTAFSVNEKGTDYLLPTHTIGDFKVMVLDDKNTTLSQFQYSVVGSSQQPLAKNAELSIKLNKANYQAGDDIELEITAPYTGGGLITIERDKVYATQWFKTTTTSSVQKIHIPKDFQGNGYVNVTFVRDWNSPDIFISPLSFSVAPFAVSHENHAIHIDLTTPTVAKPGEPFAIDYKSDKPGKIIVFAVDEGILQVTNYKTPDPLAFFFQKHALEVVTQQTVDQILPKFVQERELSAVGGDAGEAALRNHLNPFKRKTDLPVVYWSGIVDTDANAKQLVYHVPDYFNGSLRVMAVAVAGNAVGSTDKMAQIRGNFVINPNVPTFVAPGDEFEMTASIANNVKDSGTDAKVSVQLSVTPQLEMLSDSNQTLTIAEGHEATVHFKLRAKAQLGSADVTLVANSKDKFSKMHSTVSVRPASDFMTGITSGIATDKSKTLNVDRNLYPEYRNVQAVVSNSPLILVVGLQRYLDNFPYGCTEQLTSKALPLLAIGRQPWFAMDTNKVSQKIAATVQMLAQRQMSSGGFSYWPLIGEYSSNAFASVYALHFLTEARLQGYDVPNDLLRNGLNYLKELVAQTPTNLDQARIQAYAIYVLTRNEIVTTNYLTNLLLYLDQDKKQAWHHDIIGAYIASTYALLKNDQAAQQLIGQYKPQNTSASASDFYDANIADAQYLYLLAEHFPDRLRDEGQKLVMPLVDAMNNDGINTVLSGYTTLALNAYAHAVRLSSNGELTVSETFADKRKKDLMSSDPAYQAVNVDDGVKTVTFHNPNKQTYFYQLTQSGFDLTPPTDALKKGIEIDREYRDEKGNALTSVPLGTEVEVHILVRALDDQYLNNVAIVDLLPGGFEVMTDSVKTENMDYADVREDRVVFFGSVNSDAKEIVYRIKATNTGKYTVPSIFAGAMYNPNILARSAAGEIEVTE